MNRLLIIVGFVILSDHVVRAQAPSPNIALPDSIAHADLEWVDLDNDGLLDILLLMKTQSSNCYISVIKGDTLNPLSQINNPNPIISYNSYFVADYNRDNAMDVIVSGEENGSPTTFIYLNMGGLGFEEKITTLPTFSKARLADLDNDAIPELVVTGTSVDGNYFKILKQASEYSWTVIHDSLRVHGSSIEIIDADGDGDTDLFISGKVNPDSLFSGFLINKGNFYFQQKHAISLAGNTSSGDFDGDGFFEILLMAEDETSQWVTKKYQHISDSYTVVDMPMKLKNGRPFIADLNSDGAVDVNYYGTNTADDTVNVIHYSTGETDLLPKSDLVSHRFGDAEHDGNLDLLTLRNNGSLNLSLFKFSAPKNLAPGNPLNAVALPVFNRVFMYWDKPADDHTSTKSLTYDVFLNGIANYQAGEFDLLNEKRLTVTHGNNGTENFKLLRDISPGGLQFSIQAVDNAFHAGFVCLGGTGVGPSVCATVTTEDVSACSNERVVFNAPPNALWFSFADGFLGIGSDFDFSSEKGDTLFYYNPMGEDCSTLKAWAISIKDDTLKIETNEKYACESSQVKFEVEGAWDNINWTSLANGNLGSSSTLDYTVSRPDSVFATLKNAEGCTIIKKTAVKISKPELKLSADHYKIMKGSEVQLQVEGAQRYLWTPETGLSQHDIPNPIASPAVSIQYTVTGYDSLDCSAQAQVMITVEQTGFIPNLFSPNDDGKNDQLKIYGLASAQRFSFSIYDREGALVYKTSNVSEAVQHGWDGTKNGTKQPPGVYFWKVKGEVPSGQLLLNGKDSGSIVLIR